MTEEKNETGRDLEGVYHGRLSLHAASEAYLKKRVFLITGATGFLGGNIARLLVSAGENVRALVRNPAAARLPEEVTIYPGDVLDLPSLERFFALDADADIFVIHCAGMVTLAPQYNQAVYDVNVTGTGNMIKQSLKHRVKKLVYVSSTAAIPERPGRERINEVDRFDPEAVTGHYSKSKAIASQAVLDAVKQHGLDASIVFPAGIMGPYDYGFGLITRNIIKIVEGRFPCGLTGTLNCADVRDVARGVISCCSKGRRGEGYIISSVAVTMRDLFKAVADAGGCKRAGIILPAWMAGFIAAVSEGFGKVTGRPVTLTRFTLYNLRRNNNFSSTKAEKELNYSARPFAETICDQVAWLHEEGAVRLRSGR